MSTSTQHTRWQTKSAKAAPLTSDPTCRLCDGSGWIDDPRTPTPERPWDWGGRRRCQCGLTRVHERWLGEHLPELLKAPVEPADPALVDRLQQGVWVTAPWSDLAGPLRAALCELACRDFGPRRVRVYRDSELPDLVYADRHARSFSDRDVERLDTSADVIIIRTGFQTAKNAAVSAALCDLIADRIDRPSKGLWILDDPKRAMNSSYSSVWTKELGTALDRLDHDTWGAS
jgi:hypothetical protein